MLRAKSRGVRVFASTGCEEIWLRKRKRHSIPISQISRLRCNGANGWAASKRRSLLRETPCRGRRWRGWLGQAAISITFWPTSSRNFAPGGYQLRTRPRFVEAIRAVNGEAVRHAGPSSLTRTEMLTLTAIAYLQPATRAQISRLVGREISRDVIATLRRHALVEAALRAPEPGAPIAYVTTRKFLQVFSLGSLRDLPDIEKLEEEGVLEARHSDIDEVLGVSDELEDRLLEFE